MARRPLPLCPSLGFRGPGSAGLLSSEASNLKGFLGMYSSQILQSPEGKKLKLICVLILPQMAGQD